MLELYEATFNQKYIALGLELTDDMIELFHDRERGGFFFYGSDGESLIARPKEAYDGAIPSGNSVAAVNLLRLARLTGNENYQKLANNQLETFAKDLEHYPPGYSYFLMAAYLGQEPAIEIILTGSKEDVLLKGMLKGVQGKFLPNAVIMTRFSEDSQAHKLLPPLVGKETVAGKPTAYVCKDFACQAPVTNLRRLEELISD
ncbi:hypothetical protein N752_21025 [Desulforamulus aquiferis]|nr:hypothetical protein N752_21025 [Desulforamulus aquiferis]